MTEYYTWECWHDKPKWEKIKVYPQWKKHPFFTFIGYLFKGLLVFLECEKFFLYFVLYLLLF